VRRVAAALAGLAGLAGLAWSAACTKSDESPGRPARLLLTDVDADPKGLGGHPGAIFSIDPESGTARAIASFRAFRDPVDVMADEAVPGGTLVLDLCEMGGVGHLWRVSPDGAQVEDTPASAHLVDPTAFARAPDGSVWIVDRAAHPADGVAGPAALLRCSPDLRRVDVVASGAPLLGPSDLLFDGDTLWLLDADALRQKVADLSEGALYKVDRTSGRLELAAALKLVSPLSLVPRDASRLLVVDVNADPIRRERLRGAVYSVDVRGRDPAAAPVELFVRDEAWRDPSSGVVWNGALVVADGSTDPLGLGDDPVGIGFAGKGRGGVYSVDLATRAVRLVCASREFVNPARLRVVR
jgi:hypothetical protein